MDTIISIITDLALDPIKEYVIAPIKRHISYAFTYKSKVEYFKNQVKELTDERDTLQFSVDEDTRRGRDIIPAIQNWMTDVNRAILDAEIVIAGEDEARKKSCNGLLPNLKMRYRLGKTADKGALAITELHQKRSKFDKISYLPALKQTVVPSMSGQEALESRLSILKQVLDALTDPGVNLIGVYGMGGVGKSTLAQEIHRQVIEDNSFDLVVMATVSQKPDIEEIQNKIADVMGLEIKEVSRDGKALRLRQELMKRKKVLIILDDVWEEVSLETVGIPSTADHQGCKLLITSRKRGVVSYKCGKKEFDLGVLSEEEAQSLFQKEAGEIKNLELKSIADEIARKCAGLPLLITTMAKSLQNKELDEWKVALQQLSEVDSEGIQEKVYLSLELSYNFLKDGVKSFFLLCGLDGRANIPIGDLLKHGIALGLFNRIRRVEVARNLANKYINDLKTSCLLLDGDKYGCVRMHDLVRDTAVSIARKTQPVFSLNSSGVGLKEWPDEDMLKNCIRISLPDCHVDELPQRLECQEAEFLMLSCGNRYSFNVPDMFFEGIRKLKVLHLSNIYFASLPTSLGSLTNLHSLCLEECSLYDAAIIGELKTLEILSFRRSMMKKLPTQVGQLTRLKYLDVVSSNFICIPANVLSRLSQLQVLYVGGSFDRWEFRNNASLTELQGLSHLTTLEIQIPDVRMLPKDLFPETLERYKIVIGNWPAAWFRDRKSSRTLMVELYKSMHLEPWLNTLLKKTEDLSLKVAEGIKDVFHDLDREGFKQLKHLCLEHCPEILYIINSTRKVPGEAFPILESLSLYNLTSLEKICYGPIVTASFTDLTILEVYRCDRLNNLFTLSMVRSISKLQILEVSDCDKMEHIVASESDGGEDKDKVVFTHLRFLRLAGLPRLQTFCSRVNPTRQEQLATNEEIESEVDICTPSSLFNEMVEFLVLEEIEISKLDNVKMIWQGEIVESSFRKLKFLRVSKCEKLETLFPLNVLGTFRSLEKLQVSKCNSLQEIYQFQEQLIVGETSPMVAFELRELKIEQLAKLKHIWSKDPQGTVSFRNLRSLWVSDCQVLENLFSASISDRMFPRLTSLELYSLSKLRYLLTESEAFHLKQLQELSIAHCESMEEVIQSGGVEGKLVQEIIFDSLNFINLENLPSLSSFYSGSSIMKCPSLKYIIVNMCQSLKMFISTTSREQNQLYSIAESIDEMPFFSHQVSPNVEMLSLNDQATLMALQLQPHLPEEFLSQIKVLRIESIGFRSTVCLSGVVKRLQNLQVLDLSESSLKELFQHHKGIDATTMPQLRKLQLSRIYYLEHLWKQDSQPKSFLQYLETLQVSYCSYLINLVPTSTSFQHLTSLEVYECRKLINLVTSSVASSMGLLVTMRLENCNELVEIIANEKAGRSRDKIIFSRLKHLHLDGLSNLESFCSGSHSFDFPSLEQVTVDTCPKMRIFCHGALTTPKLRRVNASKITSEWYWKGTLNSTIEEMYMEMVGFGEKECQTLKLSEYPNMKEKWHSSQLPQKMKDYLRGVNTLEVDNCTSFSHAISSNVLVCLKGLRYLIVEKCDSVEQVFDLEGVKNVDEEHVGLMSYLDWLQLIDLPNLRHIWNHDPQGILGFRNLCSLKVQNCNSLTSVFTLSTALALMELRVLEVKGCSLMEQIIAIEKEEETAPDNTIFPWLSFINLVDLPRLTRFYSGRGVINCPSLTKITLANCPHMKIFGSASSSMDIVEENKQKLQGDSYINIFNGETVTQSLEEVKVEWHLLKEIWNQNSQTEFIFCKLRAIELMGFPGETALLPSDFFQRLPNLKILTFSNAFSEEITLDEVSGFEIKYRVSLVLSEEDSLPVLIPAFQFLKGLKVLQPERLNLLLPSSTSFQKLTTIKLSKCNELVNLFTSSTATRLVQLTILEIKECEMLEEIVTDGVIKDEEIVFSQLNSMELECLPCLTCFCSGKNALSFPSLQSMAIVQCPKMKFFNQGAVSAPKIQGIWTGHRVQWKGSINDTIQDFDAQMGDEEN